MRALNNVVSRALVMSALLASTACTHVMVPGPMGYHEADYPKELQRPTVDMLVRHITCELYTAINDRTPDSVWQRLQEDNFVAVVQLRLEVTDTDTFAPNLSFIHPITAPAGTVGANGLSRVLAVAGSYSNTRDSISQLNYPIDLAELAKDEVARDDPGEEAARQARNQEVDDRAERLGCWVPEKHPGETRKDISEAERQKEYFSGSYLGGDLRLKLSINDGLSAIDSVSEISLYGTTGPTKDWQSSGSQAQQIKQDAGKSKPDYAALAADTGALKQKVEQTGKMGVRTLAEIGALSGAQTKILEMSEALKALPAPASPTDLAKLKQARQNASSAADTAKTKQPGGSATGGGAGTSFSSTIQFAVTKGVNGGPNWTLVHFKGPGGGGGGGGGGVNLLSYSTTHTDEMIITFSATCSNDPPRRKPKPEEPANPPKTYWETIPSCNSPGSSKSESANSVVQNLTTLNLLSTTPLRQQRR